MKRLLIKLMIIFSFMLIQQSTYAGTGLLFNVTSSGTPITAKITLCLNGNGPLSCQQYDVSQTILSITPTINRSYPSVGIKVNTPGYTATGCTSISNGYCIFSASNTTPATINLNNNSSVKSPRFAYVSSYDSAQLTLCSVAADGTFSNCNSLSGPGPNNNPANTFGAPESVAVNNVGTFAYIADYYSGVLQCSINSSNGSLSNCAVTANDGPTIFEPESINLNPNGTFAYIGNYSSSTALIKCSVNSVTGNLNNCVNTTENTFNYPTNVVYASSGNKAYVGNFDHTYVYLCDLNSANGDLSNCSASPSSSTPNYYSFGIAPNLNSTILYISGYNVAVKCPIDATNDELTGCTTTGYAPGGALYSFNETYGLTVNAAGTLAYIVSDSPDKVTKCNIDTASGDLTNCVSVGSSYNASPLNLAFLY